MIHVLLRRLGRAAVIAAMLAFVAGCASNRVISDGPHANLMLKGYDPVAYFTVGRPVPGRVDIAVQHDGLDYRFTSDEHRKMFLANPEQIDFLIALDAATTDVVSVRSDETLRAAMTKLNFRGFSEIPVVDAEGRLAGMLAHHDVINTYSKKVLQAKL